jgi:hypothetical protein
LEGARIVGLCVISAIAYGIAHDNITARVCVEYFTIGHPNLFGTTDPTLLALGWGVVATWWMGALLGVPLAWACRWGGRPKLAARDLVRPIARLLAVMALSSSIAGLIGYFVGRATRAGSNTEHHFGLAPGVGRRFVADLFAHNAAYAIGLLGGILVIVWAWRVRIGLARPGAVADAGLPARSPPGLSPADAGE